MKEGEYRKRSKSLIQMIGASDLQLRMNFEERENASYLDKF